MIDLSNYKEEKPKRIKRILWRFVNKTLFRCMFGPLFKYPRNAILKLFGAKIPWCSVVYSSCTIYAPWNLIIGAYACVGPRTELYNKDKIIIGDNSVISQGAFLCTASHDISDKFNKLITRPICIGDDCWVAADAFIGMGVSLGDGCVVGARAAVFKDVNCWTVVGGNPATVIKKRELK